MVSSKSFVAFVFLMFFLSGCTSDQPTPSPETEAQPTQTFSCPTGEIVTDILDCPAAPAETDVTGTDEPVAEPEEPIAEIDEPAVETEETSPCVQVDGACGVIFSTGEELPECCGELMCHTNERGYGTCMAVLDCNESGGDWATRSVVGTATGWIEPKAADLGESYFDTFVDYHPATIVQGVGAVTSSEWCRYYCGEEGYVHDSCYD